MLTTLCALGIPWILEQPASSVMEHYQPMAHLAKVWKVFRIHLWIGAYGGNSYLP